MMPWMLRPELEQKPRSWRRRIAGLVILIGLLALGAHFFGIRDRMVPVDFRYTLPETPAPVQLEADYRRLGSGDSVRTFETRLISDGVRHHTSLPPGEYDVVITVTFPGGASRRVHRTAVVKRNATVTIDLSSEVP